MNFRVGVATRAAAAARPTVRMRCCRRLLIGLGEGRVRATWYDANLQPMPVRLPALRVVPTRTPASAFLSIESRPPPFRAMGVTTGAGQGLF